MATKLIFDLNRRPALALLNHIQCRNVVNVPPTATGKRRFRKEVETDPHKLVNYCCGLNYHIDEPPIKLKSDEEYPDWLWTLRLGPKLNSWELEPGTKEYYLRLKEEEKDRNYLRRMTSDNVKKVVGKVLKDQADYLHYKRFAALAHLEDDVGLEMDSTELDWYQSTGPRRVNASEYYLPYDENRVLYMDKIPGNKNLKNFYRDSESSFAKPVRMEKFPNNTRTAIQDSKRRHRYAGT